MPTLGASFRLAAALLLAPAVASAQSAADFYRGKTINVIASTGPGDGIDNAARMMSRFLVNHLPGNPLLVNKNMPGAGHVLAANYLANEAPRDGTVLLSTVGPIVSLPLLRRRGLRSRWAA